jgi:hypothetical protein
MSKRKWGESFLKSGMPLEHLALQEFKKLGWNTFPHIEVLRSIPEKGWSWFEIDFEADAPDCNEDTELYFLVECKYHDPTRFWMFLPHQPNRWAFDDRILNIGPLQTLCDPRANSFLDLAPASSGGVVLSEHGEKQENAFQKAVYQIAGGLVPKCLSHQYEYNLDVRSELPPICTAMIPAIVTNASLFRMRPDVIRIDDIREASSPADIADEMPWTWYYFDPSMEIIDQHHTSIYSHMSDYDNILDRSPASIIRMRELAGRPNWIAVINIEHLTSAVRAVHDRFLTCPIRPAADVHREQKSKARKRKALQLKQTPEQRLQQTEGTSLCSDATRRALAKLTPRQEKLMRIVHGIGESARSVEAAAFEWGLPLEEVEKEYSKAVRLFKKHQEIV